MSIIDRVREAVEAREVQRKADMAFARVQESIASQLQQELTEEDTGWRKLTEGAGGYDLTPTELRNVRAQCIKAWQIDPSLGTAGALLASGAFGTGEIRPRTVDGRVQSVVDRLWDDEDNRLALFSRQAMIRTSNALLVDGERFLGIHASTTESRVKLSELPCSEVVDIVSHPENALRPVLYRRTYRPQVYDLTKGQYQPGPEQTVYYADWRCWRYILDQTFTDQDPEWDADTADLLSRAGILDDPTPVLCYHIRGNTMGQRGIPEAYRAYDWIRSHSRTLSAMVTLAKALAMFAWRKKLNTKSATAIQSAAQAFRTPVPGVAGVQVENQNVQLDAIDVGTGGVGNLESSARQTHLQSIRPFGFGEHWYSDASCYTADTEVLTEHGWRHYWDVVDGARVACYDPKTHAIIWSIPLELHEFEVDEEIIHVESKAQDIAVTHDHRMLVRPDNMWELLPAEGARPDGKPGRPRIADGGRAMVNRDYHVVEAENLLQRARGWRVRTAPDTASQDPAAAVFADDPDGCRLWSGVRPEDFAAFVGWFVADGSTLGPETRDGGARGRVQYRVHLHQNEGEKAEAIRELLGRLPWRHQEQECRPGQLTFTIINKALWSWLRTHCGTSSATKALPRGFTTWPLSMLRALWDGAMAGDGTWSTNHGRFTSYGSTSVELIDAMQIVSVLLGYQANRGPNQGTGMCLNIQERREAGITPRNVTREHYRGTVWCYQTETGFFVTRRNGKVAIQGNTGNLATATAMDMPAIWRIEDRQQQIAEPCLDITGLAVDLAVMMQDYPTRRLPQTVDRKVDLDFPAVQPRNENVLGIFLNALATAADQGLIDKREAAYQAYTAIGSNNVQELLEKQFAAEEKLDGKGAVSLDEDNAGQAPEPPNAGEEEQQTASESLSRAQEQTEAERRATWAASLDAITERREQEAVAPFRGRAR